ncbi:MAG: SDR family oxidoreductase [Owenweeksia sp.]|nr:SDR family oxidoreductase [Owenweeksia sp.]
MMVVHSKEITRIPLFSACAKFCGQSNLDYGASSGIGREMARQANALGAKVVLSARGARVLEGLKKELSHPENALVLPLDMEQSLVFGEKVKQVVEQFGRIDLLFNNAGISQRSEVHESSLEIDRKIMEINFFGTVALTKAVLPVMRKQKSGHFAVISSITGKTGFYERSAYAASKHALHGFFESLRLEEEKNNIKVTIICPGPVRTNISVNSIDSTGQPHGQMDKMQEEGMPVEDCVKQIIKSIQKDKLEVFVSQGPEAFGMKLKALMPRLYFKMVKKRKARG